MTVTLWDAVTILGTLAVCVGLYLISWPYVLVFVGACAIYVGVRRA